MKEVPNIISTKDLSYIKDMLKWNFNIIKKCNEYISLVKDETISNYINKVYKMHKSQYETLLEILK